LSPTRYRPNPLNHVADHTGVPNVQLIKDKVDIAEVYRNQSIAEQNSVDLSWQLLMDDRFKDFRSFIYSTEEERKRFRQLVVNGKCFLDLSWRNVALLMLIPLSFLPFSVLLLLPVVLATDICDKQLKELRNNRWEKAFSGKQVADPTDDAEVTEDVNRKATIVLEHLIQASDVAHTMQHWDVYRKWNEAFFEENMRAFKQGRADKDPANYWYLGELGFFDFYIIPLAKKLKDCGVFGVASDEYLNYALSNRRVSCWLHRSPRPGQRFIYSFAFSFIPLAAPGMGVARKGRGRQDVRKILTATYGGRQRR